VLHSQREERYLYVFGQGYGVNQNNLLSQPDVKNGKVGNLSWLAQADSIYMSQYKTR
jgi:hypothetical protein